MLFVNSLKQQTVLFIVSWFIAHEREDMPTVLQNLSIVIHPTRDYEYKKARESSYYHLRFNSRTAHIAKSCE